MNRGFLKGGASVVRSSSVSVGREMRSTIMQDEMARSRQDLKLKAYRNHDVAEAANVLYTRMS